MEVMLDTGIKGVQMLLVLLLAPLLTGYVRKVKARILRRLGPPILQPYRDLLRLSRKEVVLAENASWLFRATPYVVFAATWVAAALVPTFATGLTFSWSADLIAIIALLGGARFFLALAGMDAGTSFGGIGSSREMMIASLAEPAMVMIVFTMALLAGSTQLSTLAGFMISPAAGLRVSAANIRGLTETHPALGWSLVLGMIAIMGMPPMGIFMSEFLVVSSTFARMPLLAVPLVAALLVGIGALFWRLHGFAFGQPKGSHVPVEASYLPMAGHLGLVLLAGIYLPPPLVAWFQHVAHLLG
jgi:NADH:ubiquinone oxidoreductase subunit 4 (subunit M)